MKNYVLSFTLAASVFTFSEASYAAGDELEKDTTSRLAVTSLIPEDEASEQVKQAQARKEEADTAVRDAIEAYYAASEEEKEAAHKRAEDASVEGALADEILKRAKNKYSQAQKGEFQIKQ